MILITNIQPPDHLLDIAHMNNLNTALINRCDIHIEGAPATDEYAHPALGAKACRINSTYSGRQNINALFFRQAYASDEGIYDFLIFDVKMQNGKNSFVVFSRRSALEKKDGSNEFVPLAIALHAERALSHSEISNAVVASISWWNESLKEATWGFGSTATITSFIKRMSYLENGEIDWVKENLIAPVMGGQMPANKNYAKPFEIKCKY